MSDKSYKLTYSAIGSWSGYIYQGMCATYVVLDYILKECQSKGNADQLYEYKLYLDAYDDFSIHHENGQGISLHQCKLYKATNSFEEAQAQLLETKNYWVQKNVCTEDTDVFFHSNQKPELMEGVLTFQDFEGDCSFDAETLSQKIYRLLAKIFETKGIERPQKRVYAALISWIDSQVIDIHNRYLNQQEKLRDIATDQKSAIRFKEIISILFEDDFARYPRKDFYKLLKYEFLHSIEEEREDTYVSEEDWEGGNPKFVQILVDYIGNMPIDEFEDIVQRLLPVEHIRPSETSERNVCNSSMAQEIIQLIARSCFELSSKLDWSQKSKRQTPIAIKQLSLPKVCKQLYKNRANLDCLREYDILVTKDGDEFIPNIRDKLSNITKIAEDDNDYKNIFKEKKVGLLSVSKFNTGNYE